MEPIIRECRFYVVYNVQVEGWVFREAVPIMSGFNVFISLFQESITRPVRLPNGQYGLNPILHHTLCFLEATDGQEQYFKGQSYVRIRRCGIPGTASHMAEIELTGNTHTGVPYVVNAIVYVTELPTLVFLPGLCQACHCQCNTN